MQTRHDTCLSSLQDCIVVGRREWHPRFRSGRLELPAARQAYASCCIDNVEDQHCLNGDQPGLKATRRVTQNKRTGVGHLDLLWHYNTDNTDNGRREVS